MILQMFVPDAPARQGQGRAAGPVVSPPLIQGRATAVCPSRQQTRPEPGSRPVLRQLDTTTSTEQHLVGMSNSSTHTRRLIVVLGDQLTPDIAALRGADRNHDVVLLAEVADETTYVRHHKKKIALVLAAMRHFAAELAADGWTVDHVSLTNPANSGSLAGEIERATVRHDSGRVVVTGPGEWRLQHAFEDLNERLAVPLTVVEDDRFLCSKSDFANWAAGRKQLRMEHFYRYMRKRLGVLMDGDAPTGGRWNFDRDNRKSLKRSRSSDLNVAGPKKFAPDCTTKVVLHLVAQRFEGHFGTLRSFWFGVTRRQAEAALDHFIATGLPWFGDYQDAMLKEERFLFHGVLSLYLNIGLLDPILVCRRIESAYRDGTVPLNAAEGFIRQIIGWREYVRGIYWLKMPGYRDSNFLNHRRPLPEFYWSGETDMACLRATIGQTREEAYAHHIQRLMITGNFALLAGVDPRAVHEWYLTVYADAYEWVELPNTMGMSQYADGGLLASKPYVASGNYIDRMSDYCADCRYRVKDKTGPDACPFNYLYWDFLARHREALSDNPRLGPVYRNWKRMDTDRQAAIRDDAAHFLATLNPMGEAA
jgi:deoxyribodipyrimidine photolyase-related protein